MARVPIELEDERDVVIPTPVEEKAVEEIEEESGGLLNFGKRKRVEKDKVEPKRGPGRPPGTKSVTALRKGLTQQFALIGMGVYAFNAYDGTVILNNGEKLAENLARVAEQNPAVKRALEGLLVAGVWSGLGVSVATIAIPIMANHRLVPPEMASLVGADDPRNRSDEDRKEPPPEEEGLKAVV